MIHKAKEASMLKIKLLRISRGFSQWELARDAGLSQGRYSMIERGLIDPTEAERAGLAKVLNANPATLFRSAVRASSAPAISQPELAGA
jgi:transcriptional regulator with XRE-family HTH domain